MASAGERCHISVWLSQSCCISNLARQGFNSIALLRGKGNVWVLHQGLTPKGQCKAELQPQSSAGALGCCCCCSSCPGCWCHEGEVRRSPLWLAQSWLHQNCKSGCCQGTAPAAEGSWKLPLWALL